VASDRPELPDPITWSQGLLVPAPQLRTDVSNSVDLFTGPPAFFGGQLVSTQNITNNTWSSVGIDAEYLDEWNGHRQNSNEANYYSPLIGYYLCEVGMAFPSGSVMCSAGIQAVSGGGSQIFYGCQRAPFTSRNTGLAGAKLLLQSDIIGWGSGDFLGPAAWQNSGSTITLVNAASQFPYFSAKWVNAGSGVAPLAVPVNAAFPSPPTPLSASFMNTNITNAVNFLAYPPVMEAQYNAGVATLASATSFPQPGPQFKMDTINADTYSAYSTSTGNWTAPVAGIYYCYAQAALGCAAGAQALAAGLTVTSANYNSGSTFTMWGGAQTPTVSTTNCAIVRRRLRLNAGDVVSNTGYYRDSSAASATIDGIAAQWTTRFITVWESA
jgi:hypothetical protein